MYIPKSQIKSNLYTEGTEFIRVDNNLPYNGYYYKTSKGKFYTGKTPEEGLKANKSLKRVLPSILMGSHS